MAKGAFHCPPKTRPSLLVAPTPLDPPSQPQPLLGPYPHLLCPLYAAAHGPGDARRRCVHPVRGHSPKPSLVVAGGGSPSGAQQPYSPGLDGEDHSLGLAGGHPGQLASPVRKIGRNRRASDPDAGHHAPRGFDTHVQGMDLPTGHVGPSPGPPDNIHRPCRRTPGLEGGLRPLESIPHAEWASGTANHLYNTQEQFRTAQ